ncbi:DUF2844 domain-containing protein [Paraburkholderia hayleyella]|uniref:DUF2844 domain-containing protein n=1 Tax=Paraburkholderia hayleyella TaxID=2152889 RepID=UPI001292A9A2|nr:DUF2844 domain-containing protein [Paraburkholderia hayleyella]
MFSYSGRIAVRAMLGVSSALLLIQPVWAELGGSPMALSAGATSVNLPSPAKRVASVAAHAAGTSAPQAAASFTVRETTLATGTVVREYIGASDTVFGLSWSGPRMPDLRSLLGQYFPQYVAEVEAMRAQRGGGLGPALVDLKGLVVHSGGHMGAFSGQAWVPQALPAGFSSAAIQ